MLQRLQSSQHSGLGFDTGDVFVNKGQFIAQSMQENPTIGAAAMFEGMLSAGYITTLASVQSGMSRFRKSGMLTPNGQAPNGHVQDAINKFSKTSDICQWSED